MKKSLFTILLLLAATPLAAQLYHPGEKLEYRVSYKAKMFPNTEVGTVEITTEAAELDGAARYKVRGVGRTLPTYRWFFNLEDIYTLWIDPATLRTERFECDNHEGDYTFRSTYLYNWADSVVDTRWQSRQRPWKEKRMPLSAESMDAVSLFFNLRTVPAEQFEKGETATLKMVLEDTIRHLKYRYIGREVKKIRNMGKFNALRFECQLGSSEGFTFTDGSTFTIWISDDENRIPLYIESPVRVGSINAYIAKYRGLKYEMKSKKR